MTVESLSYYQQKTFNVIAKNKNKLTEADIALAKRFTGYGQVEALKALGTEQAELILTLSNISALALSIICHNKDGSYRTATEADIELAKQFKLASQVEVIGILEDVNHALKFIYKAQISKLKEYGKDNFEQALTDGKTAVTEFDVDKLIGSITQFATQHNQAETICKYHALFSHTQSCLNNVHVLENNEELTNAFPMDVFEKLRDVTMLNNQENILTSEDPKYELACTTLPLMFNAICSGDLNTEL